MDNNFLFVISTKGKNNEKKLNQKLRRMRRMRWFMFHLAKKNTIATYPASDELIAMTTMKEIANS